MKAVIKVFEAALLLALAGMLTLNIAVFADSPAQTERSKVTLYVSGMT